MSYSAGFNILIKQAAKRELVRAVLEEWHAHDPAGAKEIVRFIREVTAQDCNQDTGGWAVEDAEGYLKIRFPQDLLLALRAVIPDWGDDDADLKDFFKEFPDMAPRKMRKRVGA
jgi:hypothetical protein